MIKRKSISILASTYERLEKLAEAATKEMGTPISVPRLIDLFAAEKIKELKARFKCT
jgi:hypothetical protein